MAVGKKLRFEVFKRDSFTCQYCGGSAPTVVLHVDHIHPVSKGGKDEILNLITSCQGCNLGKSNRELSDTAVVTKQLSQMAELQERREQLELLIEWRKELESQAGHTADQVESYFQSIVSDNYILLPDEKKQVEKIVREFGVEFVLDQFRTCADTYLKADESGAYTQESISEMVDKVFRRVTVERRSKKDPIAKPVAYIKGILRNRLPSFSWHRAKAAESWIRAVHEDGGDLDKLEVWAKTARNYDDWQGKAEAYLEELNGG